MSTSLAQAGFDAASLADITVDAILDSSNMMSTFFGIQTGGSVQNGGGSVSDAWRGSILLMETDANWLIKSGDKSNVEWTSSTGAHIASVEGMKGSYVNEVSWDDTFTRDNVAAAKFSAISNVTNTGFARRSPIQPSTLGRTSSGALTL